MITMLGLFIVATLVATTFCFTKYSREKGAVWLQHLFGISGAPMEHTANFFFTN